MGTDEYDYYGDAGLWVFGVMNGPPAAEVISATRYGWSDSEPDPYDLELPDGSTYFYCICRDDDPLPDHRGVHFPRQISDLAYAGGSFFVAIVQSEETLLILDTAASTVEEYQIPTQDLVGHRCR